MKRIVAVLAVIFSCVALSLACENGSVEWKGSCAAMPQAIGQTVDRSAWISSEKPSHHPEPAWQRGEVKVIEIRGFATEAEEADAQIKFAKVHPSVAGSSEAHK